MYVFASNNFIYQFDSQLISEFELYLQKFHLKSLYEKYSLILRQLNGVSSKTTILTRYFVFAKYFKLINSFRRQHSKCS